MNGLLMVMLNINCINESNDVFPMHNVRMIGALGSFLLWVKLFYWMRLFKSTAYFITLITQVILDIRVFMGMLFIMFTAFASFFKVLNKNTPGYTDSERYHYVDNYIGQSAVDAMLAMYLIALGEFDLDGFSKGPNTIIVWVFFSLASFLILIVCMNMLIAIMTDTFNEVQRKAEETSLSE